ncbi:MAG: outer membrane beta-barrel protein, partial [Myxococcota bacterium]|nr:outer membrane beta-barrel protein [Myxococcota bacterium]
PKHWGRGYFVFSPPSKGESVKVVEKDMSGAQVRSSSHRTVRRSIDRRGSLKIGARASSYVSSYANGFESAYADLGAGGVLGYRLFEPIGLEVGYTQYAPEMDFELSTRSQSTLQGSAQLYLFPWTRVSPYISGGYTVDQFDIQDQQVSANGMASGPHGGIGVEWAIGRRLAFGVESRYILYKNMDVRDGLRDNALQVFGGIDLYF